jgi:hypothetical protein
MSAREQKLLIFFALAGFLIVNFLAYGYVKNKQIEVNARRNQASQQLATAEVFRESREQVVDEMDWLAENEPEPMASQDALTQLQELVEREAQTSGLTIKVQKPLPTDITGANYHRAKLQITVSGTEEALYRWLDRLNVPEKFRCATQIRLTPNNQDDTKIECAATIEQWFVPQPNT